MDSDDNQEIIRKTSQVDQETSLILQAKTISRTTEQQHPSFFQWKLWCGNGRAKGKPPRLCFRISRHNWNQKLIKSP